MVFLGSMGFFWLVFHCTFPCLPEKVCPGVLHFHRWMFAVWAFPMSTTARSGHAGCGIWPDLRAASPWSWWQVRRENHGSWGPIHRSLWFCVPRFIEVPRFIKVDFFPGANVAEIEVCFPAWSSRNSNFGSWTPESAMAPGSGKIM